MTDEERADAQGSEIKPLGGYRKNCEPCNFEAELSDLEEVWVMLTQSMKGKVCPHCELADFGNEQDAAGVEHHGDCLWLGTDRAVGTLTGYAEPRCPACGFTLPCLGRRNDVAVYGHRSPEECASGWSAFVWRDLLHNVIADREAALVRIAARIKEKEQESSVP